MSDYLEGIGRSIPKKKRKRGEIVKKTTLERIADDGRTYVVGFMILMRIKSIAKGVMKGYRFASAGMKKTKRVADGVSERGLEGVADASGRAIDWSTGKYNEVKSKYVDSIIKRAHDLMSHAETVSITVRSNNEHETRILFAGIKDMLKNLPGGFKVDADSVLLSEPLKEIDRIDFVGKTLSDKRVYIQSPSGNQSGPFYELMAVVDVRNADIPRLIRGLNGIYRDIKNTNNQVQIEIEHIDWDNL